MIFYEYLLEKLLRWQETGEKPGFMTGNNRTMTQDWEQNNKDSGLGQQNKGSGLGTREQRLRTGNNRLRSGLGTTEEWFRTGTTD